VAARVSALVVRGWAGPGEERLGVAVAAGECRELALGHPHEVLARVAGLGRPWLWVRLDDRDLGRAPAAARARAGLATVDGRLPLAEELTVLDVLLLGRPLPGPFGIRGLAGHARGEAAERREAAARALAGRFGLGPLLDVPLPRLDPRQRVIVDLARALLGEPRAVVAVAPDDAEAAAWFRQRLADEAAARGCAVLVLGTVGAPRRQGGDRLPRP
jgi:hypothetical protein